jgi:hypothetical protein
MKKILIVTSSFYPEISPRSFRATELAKELVRQGHEVKVITHFREGIEIFCKHHGILFKDLGPLTWSLPNLQGHGYFRLLLRVIVRLSILFFEYPFIQLIPLIRKALKSENNFDLMISIAVPYPTHWGVSSVRTKANPIARVWVADCGDPYMGQENDTFKPPFYFAWIEKWFCKKADFLTVPTIGSFKGYYPEFHHKMRVIPQGFRFEDIRIGESKRENNCIKFGYGGMFIPGRRDPSEFLEYLNTLTTVKFEFYIFTPTPQHVQDFANKSNGKIKVLSPINRDELLYQLSMMDFVVNFENKGTAQTPSKLIDYAIIEKPILTIKTGDLNKAIINEFLKGNYQNQLRIENPNQYRIENVAKQFIDLIN